MDNFDYDDISELENDLLFKGYKTPQQIMEHNFNNVHNRNWKSYIKSIEWDTWCKHDTEEEKQIKLEEIRQRKKQYEMETHPFRQWF